MVHTTGGNGREEHEEIAILAGLILAIVHIVTGHPSVCVCNRCGRLAATLKRAVEQAHAEGIET